MQLHVSHDASRLLAVPPECHQHAKNLEVEMKVFVEKLNVFKILSEKITADIARADEAVDADKERAKDLRQRLSGGDQQERSDDLEKTIRDREMVLQRLEAKLEQLELKETEQALAQLGV